MRTVFGFGSKVSPDISSCVAVIREFFTIPNSVSNNTLESWLAVTKNKLVLTLPFVALSEHEAIHEQLLAAIPKGLTLSIDTQVLAVPTKTQGIGNIKNIIAVASGKGGVGKSTTSVNLAYALDAEGARVGILDADIYGPSIPIMLGNKNHSASSEDNIKVEPFYANGLVATSIGYFVKADDATVWRGPMASRALQQLLKDTAWPELDYLIVDMPPGTGDIQLTLSQQIPVSGAVIVTTPQDLALADATKGIAMFNKVGTAILGVVENMSYHQCQNCGHKEAVFSEHGAKQLVDKFRVPLLAAMPLDIQIRQHADGGTPLQVSEPDNILSQSYRQLARQTSKYCYLNSLTSNQTD